MLFHGLNSRKPRYARGFLLLSTYLRAPNHSQAPALVKWSWRPFWGCRRYDESWMTSPGRSRARDGSGRLDALGSSRPRNIEQSPQYGPHLLTVRKHGAAIMRAAGDAATRNARRNRVPAETGFCFGRCYAALSLRARPNMAALSHLSRHARGHAVEDTASLTGRKFVAEKY